MEEEEEEEEDIVSSGGGGRVYTTCSGTPLSLARCCANNNAQLSTVRISLCIQYKIHSSAPPSWSPVVEVSHRGRLGDVTWGEVSTFVRRMSIHSGAYSSSRCGTIGGGGTAGVFVFFFASDDAVFRRLLVAFAIVRLVDVVEVVVLV